MLHLIKDLHDKFMRLLIEDPVRPSIPHIDRIGTNKDIFVLRDAEERVRAITCVSYQALVPTSETELFAPCKQPEVAVFYTIWSYQPGAGRELLRNAVSHIRDNHKTIDRFVTLSPKTEIARRFHIMNGAIVFRENTDTINYEYTSNWRGRNRKLAV